MKRTPANPVESHTPRRQLAWWTWALLGSSGFFLFLALLLALLREPISNWLPVHLHSILSADYSQDPHGTPIASVRFSIIRDLLNDRFPTADSNPDQRYEDLVNQMKTPVPTVTPMPGSTVFVPTTLATLSATLPSPTAGSLTPTPSQTPSTTPTSSATLTPSPSPTNTGVIIQPTSSPKPSTQRPSATSPSNPTITQTSPPTSTNTLIPTRPPATATLRPTQPSTATQKPPTTPPYPPPPTPYP